MSIGPDAFDYEELRPGRRKPARDHESFAEGSFGFPARSKEVAGFSDVIPSSHTAQEVPTSHIEISKETPKKFGNTLIGLNEHLRGTNHGISFACLFLFSVVLYLRPYEFFPFLSSFMSMAFYTGIVTLAVFWVTQLALEGNLTARPKEINLVLLLGAAAILSMPMAAVPADAWKVFSEMLVKTIVIFIVFVNVVRTELRLKLLLFLVLAISIYLSVNAINDYSHGLFQTGALETHDARIAGKIKGLFENSNDLALHLVTMIPIAVGLALSRTGLFRKLVFFGAAAVMAGGVIVTFSRGGFLGLVASGLLMMRRLGRKNRAATTTAMVFGIILLFAVAPGAYSSRLSTIFNSGGDLTGSSSQRTEILKRSIWVALRYPLFGVGIGNFHHKSPRNLETHNAYTQVAAEMGLPALAIYLLFLIYPLKRLRLIENESYLKPERTWFFYMSIGLQAALVGFMVSSFFGAVAYQWYVYYLVGYAVCLHRLFIMKYPPEDGRSRSAWEHPFAKGKVAHPQTAAQISRA
jgi:O-antigen ligase